MRGISFQKGTFRFIPAKRPKADAISGRAMGIAAMLVTDGKQAVVDFINAEWEKVKAEIAKT